MTETQETGTGAPPETCERCGGGIVGTRPGMWDLPPKDGCRRWAVADGLLVVCENGHETASGREPASVRVMAVDNTHPTPPTCTDCGWTGAYYGDALNHTLTTRHVTHIETSDST